MKDTSIIVVRPGEAGLVVCLTGWAGKRQFGKVGEVLTVPAMTLFARLAAEQGYRLALEIQPDGKPSWPAEGS